MKRLIAAGLVANAALFAPTAFQQTLDRTRIPMLSPEQAEILSHMSIVYLDDGNGGQNKAVRFTGINVQIVNGLEATNGNPALPYSVEPGEVQTNGLGNLIIGYQELRAGNVLPAYGFGCASDLDRNDDVRTGSHNLIVGNQHNYESFGGSALGYRNWSLGAYSTVTGGLFNRAEGNYSSVSGGGRNVTEGAQASILGGLANGACGSAATISGGTSNNATGTRTSVLGGTQNTADGYEATVSGGLRNVSSGNESTVAGGVDVTIGSAFWTATGTLQIEP